MISIWTNLKLRDFNKAMLCKGILFFFLGFLLFPAQLTAEDEEDFIRVALLGKSDLETLKNELEKFDEGMDIRGQAWFMKNVKSRGIRPNKLFKQRKDLTFVLEVTETDFVFTIFQKSKSKYLVKIYDQGGEAVTELTVRGGSSGIKKSGAAKVVKAYASLVNDESENIEKSEDIEEEEEEEADEASVKESFALEVLPKKNKNKKSQKGSKKGKQKRKDDEQSVSSSTVSNMSLSIAAGVIKRDFQVDSPDGALLTYRSSFYPGGQLDLSYSIGSEENRPGIFLKANGGFDSITFEVDGTLESSSILHIDAELGGYYSMSGNFGNSILVVRLLGGIRHTRFQIEASPLPATSYSNINMGADFLFTDVSGFSVGANVSLSPFGLFHDGASLFGESSFIYGFGAGLNGRYELSETLYLLADFQARNVRTSFSGEGETEFSDSYAIELTHNINLGVGLKF